MYTRDRFSGEHIVRPGLKLIGGKSKTRDIFYQLRPLNARSYIEPFLGSGAVWVGLPRYEFEVVSDVNEAAINFFQMMCAYPEILWKEISLLVEFVRMGGGDAWKYVRDNEPPDSVPRAAWFYVVTKYAMNGIFRRNKAGRCNSSWCKTVEGRGIYTREWFDIVVKRIQDALILNLDYRECLKTYPDEDSWVFLDPPYRKCLTTYNGISFSDQDHEELEAMLYRASYRWLLTINDDEWVRGLYRGYNMIPHEIFYSCSQTPAGRSARPELIILNYDAETGKRT